MIALLLQTPLDAVHERFARGGSVQDFLLVLLAITAGLGLLAFLNRLQRPAESKPAENNPQRLFLDLLLHLQLGVVQRDLMLRMARDLRIEHPATLLMSATLFRQNVNKWLRETSTTSGDQHDGFDHLSRLLFDEGLEA